MCKHFDLNPQDCSHFVTDAQQVENTFSNFCFHICFRIFAQLAQAMLAASGGPPPPPPPWKPPIRSSLPDWDDDEEEEETEEQRRAAEALGSIC